MHKEIRRVGTDTVVLCIHGILGSPDHFSAFIPVIPKHWGVVCLLLEGHGKQVEDFSQATMSQWKTQVEKEVVTLREEYQQILILAHSMGCLFALRQSLEEKKIQGLFLLAPPFCPTLRFSIVKTAVKLLCGLEREDDFLTKATKQAYSIEISRKIWLYFSWIPNYISLFREISQVRREIENIEQVMWVYYSKKDELVRLSSGKYLQKVKKQEIHELANSAHFYYEKEDFSFLLEEFTEFCKVFSVEQTWKNHVSSP